jgi:dTDP-4-amino-4,6-dideoxygalactose transaminase
MNLRSYAGSGLPIDAMALVRPASNAVPLPVDATGIIFTDSGAGAIYAALRAQATRLGPGSEGDRRIALPAYCCPRVLGAVLGARWTPVYFDLVPGGIALDDARPDVRGASECRAVLVADLFGLAGATHGGVLRGMPAQGLVIRDMAQCYLSDAAAATLGGGVGILSFGRGKPISVLAGGAVIVGQDLELGNLVRDELQAGPRISPMLRGALAVAYNAALNPVVYSLVRKLPGLGIGRSELSITSRAMELPAAFGRLVGAQNSAVSVTEPSRAAQITTILQELGRIGLPIVAGGRGRGRAAGLSRIPVLAPTERYAERAAGVAGHLGVTRMYGLTLPEFAGERPSIASERWPNAYALSRRLITLPAHGRLTAAAAFELVAILERLLAQE